MMSAFGIVMLFITAAIVINFVSYYFGAWKGSSGTPAGSGGSPFWKLYQNKLIPPGFVIGLVWIFIFGMLGYCFYKLTDKNDGTVSFGGIAILVYGVFALLYPFFTYASREKNANVINYIAVVGALVLGIIVIEEDVGSFYFLLPLLLWVSYVGLTDSIMYRNLMIRTEKKA
jgi:tryptophan-rich sensory protein